ncbi:MAG TPA: sensor histidine kinase [Candidatus Dormibacteraeota bacterium]|nr:sensor histidine kinase [Candidatus Dormibacteraeota bacterium]
MPTRIPAAGHPGAAGRHEALLYRGDREFLATVLPFIQEGIAAGEPVMVAVSAERISEIERGLGEDASWVHFINIREMGTNPARIIPAWVQFVEDASPDGRPVRGIGEPVWAERTPAELVECELHEALLNRVVGQHRELRLLCLYDLDTLSEAAQAVGYRTHPLIREGEQAWGSTAYIGGELARSPFGGALPSPPALVHELAFGPGQAAEVRDFVTRQAVRAELPTMRRADLEWAVTELVSNSVQHGGGHGTIQVWEEGAILVCEIHDRGQVDDPLVGRVRPPLDAQHGRGLWLVNQLCDLVQIRSSASGTFVRLHVGRAERPREVGGVPLLANQVGTALDRFASAVERRLTRSDRSLLSRLSADAEALVLSLPDAGAGADGVVGHSPGSMAHALELGEELAALRLVLVAHQAKAMVRLVLTARGRKLRDTVATARRSVLREMLAGVSPSELVEVASALSQVGAL